MAIKVWQSTTGSLTDASSWGGTALGAGDTGLFQKRNVSSVTSGYSLFTTAQLVTYPEYSGDIAFAGTGLTHNATFTGRHIHRGTGTFHLGSPTAPLVAGFVLDAPLTGKDAAVINARVGDVYVKSGHLVLGSLFSSAGSPASLSVGVYGDNARVTIEPRASTEESPTDFKLHAGQVLDKRGFLTDIGASMRLIVRGGTYKQQGLFTGSMRVYVLGGTLIYNPATSPSGETPHFYVEGGTLDVRESEFAIPTSQVIVGPNGTILGNAVDTASSFLSIDLNQDYP